MIESFNDVCMCLMKFIRFSSAKKYNSAVELRSLDAV